MNVVIAVVALLCASVAAQNVGQVVSFANGNWNCADPSCSSRVPQGSFQNNYECAEFVARSLAAGGYIPNLQSGAPQSSYGSYQYNGQTYNLLWVSSKQGGSKGLEDFLIAAGWGSTGTTNIQAGYAIFVTGSDGPYSHTGIGVGSGIIDAHNAAEYQVHSIGTVNAIHTPPNSVASTANSGSTSGSGGTSGNGPASSTGSGPSGPSGPSASSSSSGSGPSGPSGPSSTGSGPSGPSGPSTGHSSSGSGPHTASTHGGHTSHSTTKHSTSHSSTQSSSTKTSSTSSTSSSSTSSSSTSDTSSSTSDTSSSSSTSGSTSDSSSSSSGTSASSTSGSTYGVFFDSKKAMFHQGGNKLGNKSPGKHRNADTQAAKFDF